MHYLPKEKPTDNVNWNKIFAVKRNAGLKYRSRILKANIHKDQTAAIQIEGFQKEEVIKTRKKKWSLLSPLLFNALLDITGKKVFSRNYNSR